MAYGMDLWISDEYYEECLANMGSDKITCHEDCIEHIKNSLNALNIPNISGKFHIHNDIIFYFDTEMPEDSEELDKMPTIEDIEKILEKHVYPHLRELCDKASWYTSDSYGAMIDEIHWFNLFSEYKEELDVLFERNHYDINTNVGTILADLINELEKLPGRRFRFINKYIKGNAYIYMDFDMPINKADKKNVLTKKDIEKILDKYLKRIDKDAKFRYVVTDSPTDMETDLAMWYPDSF